MPRISPPYRAQTVANFFIERANQEHRHLSPMKLLKLVYYGHGWHLALTGKPLIDEQVEAWGYGPVIPSLYHSVKQFGNGHVSTLLLTGDDPITVPVDDKFTRRLLELIWVKYGRLQALQLSDLTHMPGTPWDEVYKQYGGDIPRGTDISTKLIKDYFLRLGKGKAYAH